MLTFSNSYFEDEVRDGFYIPSMVKRAWATELDVLSEVDRICEKHNIKYYAEWGTLLGAIRHAGFIPWDDDLDIGMRRADFEKFVEVAPKEFQDGFEIFTFKNHKNYHFFVARVVCKNRICFEEEHLKKFHGFPYIAGLDIFIHDNVCTDALRQERMEKTAEYVITVADNIADGKLSYEGTKEALERINKMCKSSYSISLKDYRDSEILENLRIGLYCEAEKLFASFKDEPCDEMTQVMPYSLYGNHKRIPVKYYEKIIRVPFENTTIPVPIGFDAMLRSRYGDYMRLVKNAGGHDYPFYESQKKNLLKLLDFDFPEYKFKREKAERIETDCQVRPLGYKGIISEALSDMKMGIEEIRHLLSASQEAKDVDATREKLATLQQTAIDMGSLIEQVKGEGTESVAALERLCEAIYLVYEKCEGDLDAEYKTLLAVIDKEILSRKEVVIMPYKAAQWQYVSDIWRDEKSHENTDVNVIMLPYYYKEYDGTFFESVYEGDELPDNIKVIHADDYNVKLHHPDVIYIQNPYDGENKAVSVPKEYYSEVLKRYTDRLVYVQSFSVDEFDRHNEREYKNMSAYCTVPGVVNADVTFVQSDNLRQMYIEKLTEFAGESTRNLWERKIKVIDKKRNLTYERSALYAKGKKRILFYISVSGLMENSDVAAEKLRNVVDVFSRYNDNLDFYFCVQELVNTVLPGINAELFNELKALRQRIAIEENGSLCSEKDEDIINSCDAYYGDASYIIRRFRNADKPVMILDYRI